MGKATSPRAARLANAAAPLDAKAAAKTDKAAKAAALKAAKAATANALQGLAWAAFQAEDAELSIAEQIAAAGGSCQAAQDKFVCGTMVRKLKLATGAADFDAGAAIAVKLMGALGFTSKKKLKAGQIRRDKEQDNAYRAACKKFLRLAKAEDIDAGSGKSGGTRKRKGAAAKMKGGETASETAELVQGPEAAPAAKTIPELAEYYALQAAAMLSTSNKNKTVKPATDGEFTARNELDRLIATFHAEVTKIAKHLMAI